MGSFANAPDNPRRTFARLRLGRAALLSITTILGCLNHQHLAAQQVATKTPPQPTQQQPAETTLPDLPFAVPIPSPDATDTITTKAALQEIHGNLVRLEGDVVLTGRDRVVRADRITYDKATRDLTLDGHVIVSGGDNGEYIQASRGTFNLDTQTGRFYDVTGSVGMGGSSKRSTYESSNPILFSGRLVIKTGPQDYDLYDGKVTSCLLPNPDWMLSASHFSLDGDKARAYNSTFRLLGVPILYLPYVTHPTDAEERQSGLATPIISQSSTKGFIFGEEVYIVLGRSADITVGSQYFSSRGFSESGTFRYRGVGNDFLTAHFTALQDRGYIAPNGLYTNQGGEDVTFAFRRKLTSKTRVVGDAEYLSSYVYREAFNENFNQAVSSDITSILYAVNQQFGYSTALRADRYQGLKRVQLSNLAADGSVVTTPSQEVRIFHAPSIDFTALDHHLGSTPLLWSLDASAAGLKRSQPNFTSSGIIERLDLRPELSLPLAGGGWHTLSSIAVRETIYSRSRATPYAPNQPPVELTEPVNRASVEATVDIRPPVIERTFQTPKVLDRFFGPQIRHTVEPEIVYRNVAGISNFLSILRFDDIDVASNTNELQYGLTQRLFSSSRPPKAPKMPQPGCSTAANPLDIPVDPTGYLEPNDPSTGADSNSPAALDANGIPVPDAAPTPTRSRARKGSKPCPIPEARAKEWFTWTLTQKYFFDPNFGGALLAGRRNVFDTTLDFSGIAFLTEARNISPLTSKLRMRTTSHADIEWDFDLDTGAKRFTRSNIFIDAHEGPFFGAISYARLNAPGRAYSETIDSNNVTTLTGSATSDFQQMRLLLGYGNSLKPGFSLAANANIDLGTATTSGSLQYGALQGSYNWNCCGLSVEYRKYELGSVRNEGTERFSFTLVNIGTAGNLRKAERLF